MLLIGIMAKGHTMDETNFFKWLFGAFLTIWIFVTRWTHSRTTSAHSKIDEERKDNEARFNTVHEKINRQASTIHTCKNQIEEDIKHHMTEGQIKDFVDRSIKPIQTQITVVHEDVKEILKEMRK